MSRNAFSDIMNTPADTVEQPKDVPEGTWRFTVKTVKISPPRDADSAGRVLFVMQPTEPGEDVDTSELDGFEAEETQVFHNMFMRDRRDAFRLRKFLEALGVEIEGRTLEAAAESAQGYECHAYVQHGAQRDDGSVFVNLTDFAPV